jgi:hypothetical protein
VRSVDETVLFRRRFCQPPGLKESHLRCAGQAMPLGRFQQDMLILMVDRRQKRCLTDPEFAAGQPLLCGFGKMPNE